MDELAFTMEMLEQDITMELSNDTYIKAGWKAHNRAIRGDEYNTEIKKKYPNSSTRKKLSSLIDQRIEKENNRAEKFRDKGFADGTRYRDDTRWNSGRIG